MTNKRPKRYIALMLMSVLFHGAAGVCVIGAVAWSMHTDAGIASQAGLVGIGLTVTAVILLAMAQAIHVFVDIARASARTAAATEAMVDRIVGQGWESRS